MARVKGGTITKKKHRKIRKMAKGYVGRSKNCFTIANEKVEKGLKYAYRDRRNKKRTFRNLWVARINAGARLNGMVYSDLIHGLKLANVIVDRKILAQLAVEAPESFTALAEQAKAALSKVSFGIKGQSPKKAA